MSSIAIKIPQPPRLSARWIVNARADWFWFIGSALISYCYIFLNVVAGVPLPLLMWIWSVGFDGTHIFGMASRTYFDKQERVERKRLLFGSLIFFFSLGPVLVLVGLKLLLIMIVAVWAYYHVIRQHYGFMVLYKAKNRDTHPIDNKIDRLFLAVMLVFPPFHRFFIHRPQELGLPAKGALEAAVPWLEAALWVGVFSVAAIFLLRQLQKWRRRETLNLPKYALLLAVVPLHWIVFVYMGPQGAVPTITIFHNLQYHGLIWFYNRNKYLNSEAQEAHGIIPALVSRRVLYYLGFALIFSLAYRVPGYWLGQHLRNDLAFGFFWGFGLTHYYLDSKIWRVRSDKQLKDVLRLKG